MDPKRSRPPLLRFFSGLTEYVFETRLGVADPPLVDYLAELLTRFVHNDAIYKVRNPTGRRLQELAEMLLEAEARLGSSRREIHRHIGDFALFWAGLYPEALQRRQSRSYLDRFIDYCEQGKRNYYLASTMEPEDEEDTESAVLGRLSDEFELCVYGLGEVRKEMEARDEGDEPPKPLIIE